MRQDAVDGVGDRRVDRAAGLVAGPEHEVADEQLGAPVEELVQRPLALVRVEAVLLLDANPGKFASLARELVADPRVPLLAEEELLACGQPFLTGSDPAHRASFRVSSLKERNLSQIES